MYASNGEPQTIGSRFERQAGGRADPARLAQRENVRVSWYARSSRAELPPHPPLWAARREPSACRRPTLMAQPYDIDTPDDRRIQRSSRSYAAELASYRSPDSGVRPRSWRS